VETTSHTVISYHIANSCKERKIAGSLRKQTGNLHLDCRVRKGLCRNLIFKLRIEGVGIRGKMFQNYVV
jgi:hypothetical protein